MVQIYLSRRNLEALLSKLDRKKAGDETKCTLIKSDTKHPEFPCGDVARITAVENDVYYAHRSPGPVDPRDEKSWE